MTPSMLALPGPLSAFDGPSFDGDWYTEVTDLARRTTWANGAVDAYTTYGVLLFGVLLAAAWWSARRTGGRAMAATLCAPITIAAALAVNAALKSVVAEARPCRALPHAFTVEPCPAASDYSFPSNHSAMAGAVAMAVLLINWRLGVLAAAAALLMAASRVYVGVHYPHDVIIGLAVGTTVVLAGYAALRNIALRLLNTLTRTPLRPLLTATATAPAVAN
ncbi:phosphatase PAP2 family protein [Actinacidiphila soli]|uniref:phosphatase PAP2 family protein n=1 Tax=Actinacidiphila soli TaxID=2487275 RepID=UPI001F0B7E57|nr:phosphatase PAP2 family protein [Actinacidiphila soli]